MAVPDLALVPVFAHGGTVGLALEIAFFAVPLLVFAVLAMWSGRKNREESGTDADVPKE